MLLPASVQCSPSSFLSTSTIKAATVLFIPQSCYVEKRAFERQEHNSAALEKEWMHETRKAQAQKKFTIAWM